MPTIVLSVCFSVLWHSVGVAKKVTPLVTNNSPLYLPYR